MATRLVRRRSSRGFVSAATLAFLALPALSATFLASERGQSVALHVRITRVALQESRRVHEEHRRQIDAEYDKAMAEADALLDARLRELQAGDDPFRRAMVEGVVPEAEQKKAGPTTRERGERKQRGQNQPERRER